MGLQQEETKQIILKDGRSYTIRLDRHRFFYPNEWKSFIQCLEDRHTPLFEFILNTGARFTEARHIRPKDFDFERNNVRLWKTKTRAKKGETHGATRNISISSEFSKKMKKFCKDFESDAFIFKPNTLQGANQLIKRKLKAAEIEDWYNFSTHNIRKTHGMYLKAIGIEMGELCTRLGHDYNTYIKHYGSPDVFSEADMRGIKELLGNLYMRRRTF